IISQTYIFIGFASVLTCKSLELIKVHDIFKLEDGRIEIVFDKLAGGKLSTELILFLGSRQGSEVSFHKGGKKISSVRCYPDIWENYLRLKAPDMVSKFLKVLEELNNEKE